jgi:3-oxoadipate enol-lactonase
MASFAASDGLRLAYYIDDFTTPWKQAPTLLLLHAAMGNARRYYAWVPALARHYRVVRMDLRGHGRSEIPPAEAALTLDRVVADVTELMDHLGLASAHIVGNSAGGYLGQQLAMNRGERVRSLMLFGSTPGLKNSQAPSWIPQIEAKGLRGFLAETIADRLPLGEVSTKEGSSRGRPPPIALRLAIHARSIATVSCPMSMERRPGAAAASACL